MNHSTALQRKEDGRWDYTTNGQPTGYCRPFTEFSEELKSRVFTSHERYEEWAKPRREAMSAGKYHDHGHETAEEACECYKQYRLDFELRFQDDNDKARTLHRCEYAGCNQFTSGYASVGAYHMLTLCKEHRTREVVAELFEVGESWFS